MKTYLESEELELLELSTTNPRDRLLIRLLSHLGCRVSEALALTIEDVDFQERMITIQHLKTRLKFACSHCNAKLAASHVYCPRCGIEVEKAVAQLKEHCRLRTLPLDGDTFEMIRDYVNRGGLVPRNVKRLLFSISRNQA
jgi:integrase/recombinase XerD